MDELSLTLTTAYLKTPMLKLYREKFPVIDKLAAEMEKTHDHKYITLIRAEIRKEMTEFQRSFHRYIIPVLSLVFKDRNLSKNQWLLLYHNIYDGLNIKLARSLIALKVYLENLIEPVRFEDMQAKYLLNFRLYATDKEKETFEYIYNNYLSKEMLPPELRIMK